MKPLVRCLVYYAASLGAFFLTMFVWSWTFIALPTLTKFCAELLNSEGSNGWQDFIVWITPIMALLFGTMIAVFFGVKGVEFLTIASKTRIKQEQKQKA